MENSIYIIFGIGCFITLILIFKMCRVMHRRSQNPIILTAGIPNHIPQQIIIPPGPISIEHQNIINNILGKSTELNYDVNDMSPEYIYNIVNTVPQHKLFPLQFMDEKYEDETCMICLDPLKNKKRPIVKLSCNEHYFHHSCYKTLVEDESKKKKIEYLFGQITKQEEIYKINCPFCRKKVTAQTIYIYYEGFDNVETSNTIIEIEDNIDTEHIEPILESNNNTNDTNDNTNDTNDNDNTDNNEEQKRFNETTPLIEHNIL